MEWLDRLRKGGVWRGEERGPEVSGSCSSWVGSGPWKWIAVKTGGEVAKKQTWKVKNRKLSGFLPAL